MCTAVKYKSNDIYFGRNLDLDRGYGEKVVVMPRNYKFKMRCLAAMSSHYAMIGMAAIIDGTPLFFEATNEKGVSMAGLNFPGNAVYREPKEGCDNVTPFEFIPWILGQCSSVCEAKRLLARVNLVDISFSEKLPNTPLHWMISDKEASVVVESVADGTFVYDNPFEVLTNNPPFDFHRLNVSNYMSLGTGAAESKLKAEIPTDNFSLGMGALGLPGDFSSQSRFIRVLFVKENSLVYEDEDASVNQFFHIMNSVAMPKGCVATNGGFEYTRYTSCCNANRGIYYYTAYDSLGITSANMHDADLDSAELHTYEAIGL